MGGNEDNGPSGADAVYNAATTGWVNKSSRAGGTLRLLSASDCDSWDPAITYTGFCWRLQNLYVRSLMGYAAEPGVRNANRVVPDLAEAPGRHNADHTQWTYRLRAGLKWQDGSPLTSQDVKFGLERLFASDITGGGPGVNFTDIVKHKSGYKGPYRTGRLSSVRTPDDRTITIELSRSFAGMDSLMATVMSSPIPQRKGPGFTGSKYTLHPYSSGPFRIQSYKPGQQMTLVRNQHWNQESDTIRRPLVDKITMTILSNSDEIDRKLKAGQADASATGAVQPAFQAQVLNDPMLRRHTDNPINGSTTYLSIQPSVAPFDDVHCRRAVFYALDKDAIRRASGGAPAGVVAHTMANPSVAGYDPDAKRYPVGAKNTGDPAKAREELRLCGQPKGFKAKMAYSPNSIKGAQVFTAAQASLARVGIELSGAPASLATYYNRFILNANRKDHDLGLALTGWSGDYKSPYGYWNFLATNTDFGSVDNPEVDKILAKTLRGGGTAGDWREVDSEVMEDAVYVPLLYAASLIYRNPRLTNVRIDYARGGGYDWVNLGISQ